MVVKVYISGISGNKEVKKRQQRVLMILDSKTVKYDVIDITEPGKESDKDFMQNNATSNGGTVSDPNPRSPLPPQLFNDDEYCGDYDQFDLANEVDTLEQFLKLEVPPEEPLQVENEKENTLNGDVSKESKENSQEKEIPETDKAEGDEPVKEKSPPKEGSKSREATPAKGTPSREPTPAKGTPSREATPAKGTPSREATPAKGTPSREATPAKGTPSRETTPAKEEQKEPKEKTPEKESTPERQKSAEIEEVSVEKEASPPKEVSEKHETKETHPEIESVNENGTTSSRNPSEEKQVTEADDRKKDPSELLIESEQSAE